MHRGHVHPQTLLASGVLGALAAGPAPAAAFCFCASGVLGALAAGPGPAGAFFFFAALPFDENCSGLMLSTEAPLSLSLSLPLPLPLSLQSSMFVLLPIACKLISTGTPDSLVKTE